MNICVANIQEVFRKTFGSIKSMLGGKLLTRTSPKKVRICSVSVCYCNTDDGFDRETLHIQTFLELVRVDSLPPNIDLTLPKVFLNTS